MSKKKKKKIRLKKARKNQKRNITQKYQKIQTRYELLNMSLEDLVNNIDECKQELEIKTKKNYKMIAIFSILLVLIIGFLMVFINYPFIEIEGSKNITIEYNTKYTDKGAKGVKLFKNITKDLITINNVNTSKIGSYQVTYTYKYLGINISKKRIVKVVDTKKPTITLEGEKEVTICPNAKYEEQGYTATDEYDGDLTDKVLRVEFDDYIDYIITDSSNNKDEVTRKIIKKDSTKPELTLKESSIIYITKGTKYNEPGYNAKDNCDGDLTNNVETSNNIDTNKVGTYKVNYKVKDSSNNEVSISRTVKVVVTDPSSSKGVIYLTFDDGPSNSITPKLLDILKEEGVHVTFFVIGTSNSFDKMLKREYQEGHSIALHSYTHQYDIVYRSKDAYFNDLDQIRNKVYNTIGIYSNIIRFPGGSSNTVSKKYCQGIMSEISQEAESRGYHYFDWNVSSGDAGGVHSSDEVYQNVINGLSHNRSNVVLMHDFENNYYTLNAIRDIIKYGKENGYTFSSITMDTPVVHHSIAN
jgi:peptidoglycan-N-acetylglucosamine deacetylase